MDVPFLSSGAMSRAHYALVRKVETAPSSVDQIILAEVAAIRERLTRSMASIVCQSIRESAADLTPCTLQKQTKECHILLLYCSMTLQDTEEVDFDFALSHAVNLAEAGETTQNKRIGMNTCVTFNL